jgi:2-iminobutanoate/2-iminopropanoate deaminase
MSATQKGAGKRAIVTSAAPAAIGPYSQAVACGEWLFLSGQIPLDPQSGQLIGASIEEQTEQVLKNITGLLGSQHLDLSHVVKTTVFLQSMQEFSRFNDVYARYFPAPCPARSTVEVAALPKGARVEIECVVYCPHG